MAGSREKRTGSLRDEAQPPALAVLRSPSQIAQHLRKKKGGGGGGEGAKRAKRLRGMVLLLYP